MKYCTFLTYFFYFYSILCSAQSTEKISSDTSINEKFLTLVNFDKNQSYVSITNGIGNQIPILFEAQFSPSYFISSNDRKWALMMNPQVQIRMLDKYSQPIKVPSYHLYFSLYRDISIWKKSLLGKHFFENATWYASIAHHSNGQDGSFYLNDSSKIINLTTGNFSTNFFQAGIMSYKFMPSGNDFYSLQEVKIHTEIYPYFLCEPSLKDLFGLYRLFITYNIGGPFQKIKKDKLSRWLQNSSLEFKTGWILGDIQGFNPMDYSNRLIIDINYKYFPTWFKEIAFFMRFYSGQDYYNIYFEKQLTVLTFGITSNSFKLYNNYNPKIKRQKIEHKITP